MRTTRSSSASSSRTSSVSPAPVTASSSPLPSRVGWLVLVLALACITSSSLASAFDFFPTEEPGSDHFLTDIIVDVINRTNITAISAELHNLTFTEPGIFLNVSLDKIRIGVDIDSSVLLLPVHGESNETYFNCSLTMDLLNMTAALNATSIPLNCYIPSTSQVTMGVDIMTDTTEIDVNMTLKEFVMTASMTNQRMPMNINMSLNGVSLGLSLRQVIFDDAASWIVFIIAFALQWGMLFLHVYHRYRCSRMASTLKNVPNREMTSKLTHCSYCNAVSPFEAKFCGGCGRHLNGRV